VTLHLWPRKPEAVGSVNPIVVIEVLSPDAMDRNRIVKLAFYKGRPSAQHIVMACSDQMRVEQPSRAARRFPPLRATRKGSALPSNTRICAGSPDLAATTAAPRRGEK
jgi:hypothetical protein